jgi:glycosyltransferase involved in cell wall biosynthesis
MVSFREKLAKGFSRQGIVVCDDLDEGSMDAVLVIGGTRRLGRLRALRRRGVPIVQRLDGKNWLHRVRKRNRFSEVGIRHYIRSEYGNLILKTIRARLADKIIYQSEFARRWWERDHGASGVTDTVIYNGVDLEVFSDQGSHSRPGDRIRILLVEGSLLGGYEIGLESAVGLAIGLAEVQHSRNGMNVELLVVGRVSEGLQSRAQNWIDRSPVGDALSITWAGLIAHDSIPELDRSAHMLFSADLNAACPNSVIEALGCGLPVLSFDTGALPELVTDGSGVIVPYGGDPWKLERADIPALARAAQRIMDNQPEFRAKARQRAVNAFDLSEMTDRYMGVLL